jgi:hypothetical protein
MKGMNIRMLMLAINAASPNSYVSLDVQGDDGDQYAHELVANDNPETILIRAEQERISRNVYAQLSDEAKGVIKLIINAPAEIMDVIATKKHKRISKDRIYRMLSKQWRDKIYARGVIDELVAFVRTF